MRSLADCSCYEAGTLSIKHTNTACFRKKGSTLRARTLHDVCKSGCCKGTMTLKMASLDCEFFAPSAAAAAAADW